MPSGPKHGRRIVLATVSAHFMGVILSGEHWDGTTVTSDWPVDARVVGCHWAESFDAAVFVVESSTFDEVPEGAVIPDWNPTYTTHRKGVYDAFMDLLREP